MRLTFRMFEQIIVGLRGDAGNGRDLRHSPRVGLRSRTIIYPDLLEDYAADGLMVRIRDLSTRGIGILSPRILPRGSRFTIKLVNNEGAEVVLTYRVTHCQPLSSREFNAGARFDSIHCDKGIEQLGVLACLAKSDAPAARAVKAA